VEITSCWGKEGDPTQNVDSCAKVSAAVLIRNPMDQLLNSNKNPTLASLQERRKHPRDDCFIEANYLSRNRWYRGSIQNISEGGAYIQTFQDRRFSPGENIFLVARIRFLREQLRAKITWVGPHGIGVEFQVTEPT